MFLYLTMLILLFGFGFFDVLSSNLKQKKVLLYIIFILLVFQDGLRWETGTDWKPYLGYFFQDPEYSWFTYEPGYDLLNSLVRKLFNNYSVFLIVHAIIIYTLYFKAIIRLTDLPIVTLLVFYSLTIGYMGMNRQHIALAICLYSVTYILNKEKYKFLIAILIATMFHFSALLFLICYPLNKKINAKIIIGSLIASIIIGQINFLAIVKPILEILHIPQFISMKILVYLKGEGENSIIWQIAGSLKRLIIFSLVYFNREKIKQYFPHIEFFMNVYLFSIVMYFCFNNSIQVLVSRGMLYFGILPEIFLLSSCVFIFKIPRNKIILYLILFLFVLFTFSKSISVFYDLFVPYKGIFINTDYLRKLY